MPTVETGGIVIDARAWGPGPAELAALGARLLDRGPLARRLEGTDHRLLSVLPDPAPGEKRTGNAGPPTRFTAVAYDYTNNRAVVAQGRFDDPDELTIHYNGLQPPVSDEEFDAAAALVLRHLEAREDTARQEVRFYRPMPPLLPVEQPDGRIHRAVAVGIERIEPEPGESRHRVVAADLIDRSVLPDPLDTGAAPCERQCGSPPGACSYDAGTGGQVHLTVTRAGATLWDLIVVRPSASSGQHGSGVELRFVDYRGTRVLYRAHVPVLNVRYDSPDCGCGPSYRDQNNYETCFQANGTDVIPGFRLCPTPGSTIHDSGVDGGNFRGVAIWVEGDEVVLTSVTAAGWYRYISQWRLAADGTIRPRYGFAAVSNPCTCLIHHHHSYWRLDFDIQTPSDNRVQEFNDPPIFPGTNYHTKYFEIRRQRDASHHRHWRVLHEDSGAGYAIIPGANDGDADAGYGIGDLWVLRYHPDEIDDAPVPLYETVPSQSMEHIDNHLNGEAVDQQDVVIWYAAHFRHDVAHEASEVVGPDLLPFNWP
jgi:Copper amine oxidase, enzyme domain